MVGIFQQICILGLTIPLIVLSQLLSTFYERMFINRQMMWLEKAWGMDSSGHLFLEILNETDALWEHTVGFIRDGHLFILQK